MDADARIREAGSALHDLNNALAALRMHAAAARTTVTDPAAQDELRRTEALVDEVAAASRRLGGVLAGVPEAEAPAAGEAGDALAEGTVLVVDDDAVIRAVAARLLEHAGWRATTAVDAEAAEARLLAGEPVDVLVSDLEMPGRDGRWLARRARDLRPGLPVVLLSGHAAPPDAGGEAAWLQKPFAPEALLAAVAAAARS